MATTANYVRNTALLGLLNAAEKSQSERMQTRLRQPIMPRLPPPPATPKSTQHRNTQEDGMTPVKTVKATLPTIDEPEELRTDTVPLTADEVEWLNAAVIRNGHASLSRVMCRLVEWANVEPAEAKKKLFLVIRCRRCSAGAKGGVKTDHSVELPAHLWQWLENVRERCRHASVGKTLRIIVDFYMPLCKDDANFEQSVLRIGAAIKTGRHKDAVDNVDPTRALAIKGPCQSSLTGRQEDASERVEPDNAEASATNSAGYPSVEAPQQAIECA